MTNLKLTIVFALLAFTTIQVNDICVRNKYIGGPQNTIIKAQELLNSLLQYSNVATTVLYYGKKSSQNAMTGETSDYYVFKIIDTSNAENPRRLLIMKITTFQNNTFVDNYVLVPAPVVGTPLSIAYINALIPAAGFDFDFSTVGFATNGDFFAADANAKPCNLIKEYFTYFYELFGSKFKKNLNN